MVLKPFLNKTGNRFVETGYLPVIGLRNVLCHMAVSPGKEGGRPSETQLRNHYVDDGLHEVTVVYSVTKCSGYQLETSKPAYWLPFSQAYT